ncbi:MAG: LysE family translocator [Oligoflexales bacterium]
MLNSQLLNFLIVALVLVFTPGPKVIYSINTVLDLSSRHGAWFIIGTVLANICLGFTTILCFDVLGGSHNIYLEIIKWLGIAIIIALGVKQFWKLNHQESKKRKIENPLNLLFQGYLLALLNPKSVICFSSILPQYVDFNQPIMQQIVHLSAGFLCLDLSALGLYSGFAKPISSFISTQKRRAIAGSLYILAGLVLAGRLI